jgi:hypothetical protein
MGEARMALFLKPKVKIGMGTLSSEHTNLDKSLMDFNLI